MPSSELSGRADGWLRQFDGTSKHNGDIRERNLIDAWTKVEVDREEWRKNVGVEPTKHV